MRFEVVITAKDTYYHRAVEITDSLETLIEAEPTQTIMVEGDGIAYRVSKQNLRDFRMIVRHM